MYTSTYKNCAIFERNAGFRTEFCTFNAFTHSLTPQEPYIRTCIPQRITKEEKSHPKFNEHTHKPAVWPAAAAAAAE
jgi:hypothetical protein